MRLCYLISDCSFDATTAAFKRTVNSNDKIGEVVKPLAFKPCVSKIASSIFTKVFSMWLERCRHLKRTQSKVVGFFWLQDLESESLKILQDLVRSLRKNL